ncbi:MAG: murein biosynthesis integral membrane protein MurJ [Puniceicoccaceae bacterium]
MGSLTRRISEVAGWTMASRILGLARDVLLFASLGTGILNSAFILAFTIPNLFRRLLGEGALTSSSIPVLAESLEKQGPDDTFRLLNAILSRLGIGLFLLQLVVIPALFLVDRIPGLEERWYAGAGLSQVLFPYMVFICLGALICGMLNVLNRFALAAFNQVWLNLTMIGAMLVGIVWMPAEGWGRVYLLSLAVLAGGLLQLLVPAVGLYREGWRPRLELGNHPGLQQLLKLFLPGLLGAAIFQVNILVSRFLAFSLDDTATGLLYISSRLVELPLGVFAIAVTTVIFPDLSRLSSTGDQGGFATVFTRGLGIIFMITLPAMLGLIVLGEPILGFLFQWGLFESRDVLAAVPVLAAAALGLPFFAWSTLLTRAWYARQDMKIPVRLAALNLVLNLVLGLILMRYLGAVGLALANTLSSMVHCLALQLFLTGESIVGFKPVTALKLVLALAGLVLAAFSGLYVLQLTGLVTKVQDLLAVVVVIPFSAGIYFGILWFFGYPSLRFLQGKQ